MGEVGGHPRQGGMVLSKHRGLKEYVPETLAWPIGLGQLPGSFWDSANAHLSWKSPEYLCSLERSRKLKSAQFLLGYLPASHWPKKR